ncbi:MAG: TrmB family transcriptional regulator, partial [Deltaproteobacteria bacterium]|nr:TrmB family transcriptional regulator [Deltaproteobacteria bacterium]
MSDDLLGLLGKVGLTEYESRAYAALLSENITTAGRLSSQSRVPRTKIYEVLESLVR